MPSAGIAFGFVRDFADRVKRLLVGRPVPSGALGETLLPKRIALPVFASDALSSVGYAPDEVIVTLAVAGVAATALSPWVAVAVVGVLLIVVASYRQTVHAYPSGGGDYEVVSTNLGSHAGLAVASALLADYVLTVAVSISSGSSYLVTALPAAAPYKVEIAVGVSTILALLNLRGTREAGGAFAIPTYVYMIAIGALAVTGFVQEALGTLGRAESSAFDVVAGPGWDSGLTGLAGAFLILRAFSSGCAALTGVEAISNGVPSFQRPKSKNAATTLLMLGAIAAAMLLSIIHLAGATGVHMVEDPATQLTSHGLPVGEDYHQDPVIGQLAATVFAGFSPMFYLVTAVTGLILVLAANTAFNGFPVLASVLATDGFLPRQLTQRGDRLAYSNGIIALWLGAIAFIIGFEADTNRLIQLYIVGVFISFTLSQIGMVRHWTRELATATDARERSRMSRSRIVNSIGLGATGLVLIVVLITKLTRGAWITLTIMAIIFLVMNRIHRHYDRVHEELAITDLHDSRVLPAHVHAIVLASSLHKPALRALTYALSTNPTSIEALTVDIGDDRAAQLLDDWDEADLQVPLTVLDSPYRDITRSVIAYVRSVRRESPRDLVVVFIPEYLVKHWWEQALHNQMALRIKTALLFTPGVVVASVPWQLGAPGMRQARQERRLPSAVGIVDADEAVRRGSRARRRGAEAPAGAGERA
ncbi:APC family amino acid-polyamine-organocation transporter [Actinomyces sp. Chiba101]|uniref:Amino acid transporter n=1 Tax=Actinomyces denticolens TaxID=52767 RepID=A0ABY1I556_9ACTO|nr:APC family amino acid-polyamine-organocation transporter [Actinomyces sp. Chiba101]SHI59858.1 Amino acid transporter [Actinomyces denticolens]SUU05809.1 K+ potassium transporter [Actinomyces denticolens]